MHMMLVHGHPALRNNCDSCDRDTKLNGDKDIKEDEAISDEINEAICEILEQSNEGYATSAVRNTADQDETSLQGDIADVTLVSDDHEPSTGCSTDINSSITDITPEERKSSTAI